MNDTAMTNPAADNTALDATIDNQQPWLGLASFTEETRQYFYGREEEVGELSRRVQRKLLTVLFGQSGLGKTSILNAGIVPRLRPEGFCPVYVRVDYGTAALPPSEQIKQAIFRATESQGSWTRPGSASEGESLWEFLHHRDDELRDAAGKPIIPLLIFDQFEEIFTLAQADDGGRKRAAEFIEDLADLVENRPPKALEAKFDADDSVSEQFNFGRTDYRILISLREDYLAHLEGVKGAMPSITQNRMRLARMNGEQALAAVIKPGGKLVTQEVAESIVRFVAGGAELRNAEVEPSLLSLICRELNNTRIAQGKSEISVDLLAGSHDTILAEFYERALADQPPAVRRVIEDELLTDSGYRENLAEERVLKLFTDAGAGVGNNADAKATLAALVNRRLLRTEDRLDRRRVELTHDVLCSVVKTSREARLEREAREDAEKNLTAQREREKATRKALVRARQIAGGCAVLAIVAVGAGLTAYRSELEAAKTRTISEVSRGEAEKLVVFLLDDFYDELAPVGRLDAVGKLAKSAVDYYEKLPPALQTPSTRTNHSLALLRQGSVLLEQGSTEAAGKLFDHAEKIVTALRDQGDTSVETAFAAARARNWQAEILSRRLDSKGALNAFLEALDLLKPALAAPNPAPKIKLLEVRLMTGVGTLQSSMRQAGAKESLLKAMALAREINALDLTNLPATDTYLFAQTFLANNYFYLQSLPDEAIKTHNESIALADKVLAFRPDHRPAIRAKISSISDLAQIDDDNLRVRASFKQRLEMHALQSSLLALDPSNVQVSARLTSIKSAISGNLFNLGRVDEAIKWAEEAAAMARRSGIKVDATSARRFAFGYYLLASFHARLGDTVKAQAALIEVRKYAALAKTGVSEADFVPASYAPLVEAQILVVEGKYAEARTRARQVIADFDQAERGVPVQTATGRRFHAYETIYYASMALGDFQAAEFAAREQLKLRKTFDLAKSVISEAIQNAYITDIAWPLLRQGKQAEARELLQPMRAFFLRKEVVGAESNDDVQAVRAKYYWMLALAFPEQRQAYLAQAAEILGPQSAPMKRNWYVARLAADILQEKYK